MLQCNAIVNRGFGALPPLSGLRGGKFPLAGVLLQMQVGLNASTLEIFG